MSIVLQVATLSGKTMEGARWEVPSIHGLQENQSFALSFPTKDKQLLTYLGKAHVSECSVDRENGEYYVQVSFQVRQIRHMLSVKSTQVDTLAILTPLNRNVELVVQYLVNPAKVEPKFVKMVREASPGP